LHKISFFIKKFGGGKKIKAVFLKGHSPGGGSVQGMGETRRELSPSKVVLPGQFLGNSRYRKFSSLVPPILSTGRVSTFDHQEGKNRRGIFPSEEGRILFWKSSTFHSESSKRIAVCSKERGLDEKGLCLAGRRGRRGHSLSKMATEKRQVEELEEG